ncbi:MAG TPA: T9SS type A sorting domain-containing protein [Puia sp.]|jgi:hypothetical protein
MNLRPFLFSFLSLMGSFLSCFSQTRPYTLDYSALIQGQTPSCNIFHDVPGIATFDVNFAAVTLTHTPLYGAPKLNPNGAFLTASNGVQLKATYFVQDGSTAGSEYFVQFPFKKGFAYDISADAFYSIDGFPDNTGAVDLTLRYNTAKDDASSPNTTCSDNTTHKFNPVGGIQHLQATVGQNTTNFPMQGFIAGAANGFIYVASTFPTASSDDPMATTITGSLFVKKLIINETSTLTFAPSTLSLICGDQTARTFTVSNPEGITGTLVYTWNVGNGWLFNGSVPSGPITAGNSITLTPINSQATVPNNISVSVSQNGTVINTFSCTVSTSNTAPTLGVTENNGDLAVCNGGPQSFTVSGVPAGTPVVWSTSPAGLASPSQDGTSTTLSYVQNGDLMLTATVSNVCGTWSANYPQIIRVGVPPTPSEIEEMQPGVSFPANSNATFTTFLNETHQTNWTVIGGTIIQGQGFGEIGVKVDNTPGATLQVSVNYSNTCGVGGTLTADAPITDCPTCPPPVRAAPQIQTLQPRGFAVSDTAALPTLYPNPASSSLHVYLPGKDLAHTSIRIYDLVGHLLIEKVPNSTAMTIDISRLTKGVYVLLIDGNQNTVVKKFIKN